ncbi:MAG: hypothetical protein IH968_12340 [Gemmatimonadetes bacterium]|nr:hypothetical protein [Gemmatimonadota bacterium]
MARKWMVGWFGVWSLGLLGPGAGAAAAQAAPDAFADPVARTLFEAAQRNWSSVDESVVRYTALIKQRISAAIRTPLKDRIIYRNETAVRAFWDEDYDAVVQVLGTRSQYPGRSIAVREGDMDWLDDLPFDEPFQPGGDRLFFGLTGGDDEAFESNQDGDYWIAHPLANGADSLYRYESGDTLTLSLPDGRRLQTVQLDVLPREADVHRITGTLWIEPESGALVRAVYRLSRQFDAMRDVPELQEEEDKGSFKYVPGLFKPWTFDLTMVAVDYSLWDFEVWLPRSMRMEGEARAGILKIPVSMDLSYQMESVTTRSELARGETPQEAGLEERHFGSRAEAMAFIAQLLSEQDGIEYAPTSADEDFARDRTSLMIVPEDRSLVATSPHLPPPIWEDAVGFPSDDQLEDYVRTLADLPAPTIQGLPWTANWGWARHDLIRYNRVEGPAVGGRFEASLGGPFTLEASGFFGFADLEPKARLDFERSTVRRRLGLGVYRELTTTDPRGGYLGFGNSMGAFLFGRDEGEYYRATGIDFTWRPPVGARESFELRAYAERQGSVSSEINWALFHSFGSWKFRPNLTADDVEEVGAELRLSPWWGGDPFGAQFGLELYGQAARWRITGESAETNYGRASVILRAAIPLVRPTWRLGLEVGGGITWNEAPLQRGWFLGGSGTLRGFPASAAMGSSFVRGRVEVARTYDISSVSAFGDVGWAGLRDDFGIGDFLYGVGLGASAIDGLFRIDLSHGLNGPAKQFRIDLYLDALL